MIERTDEMERVLYAALAEQEPGRHHAALRKGLDAVLAIVERDYNLRPATCDERHPDDWSVYCELPRGHLERSGRKHSATVTKAVDWEPQRCGARGMVGAPGCIRRSGHDGGHGYIDGSGEQDTP